MMTSDLDRLQIVSLILIVVASLHLATPLKAQTDYTIERWYADCKRMEDEARSSQLVYWGRCGVDARDIIRTYQVGYIERRALLEKIERGKTEQYEKDRALAVERGISIQAALAAGFVETAVPLAEYEEQQAKAQRRETIMLTAAAAAAAIIVSVITFKSRRRIASWWRSRSRDLRAGVFGCICWPVGTALYVWLVEPYGSGMDSDGYLHMYRVMLIPPLFFGAVWFGYKRFVS